MTELIEFENPGHTFGLDIWGGGHTPASVPTAQGWRVVRSTTAAGSPRLLVGRRGMPGCFSAMPLSDNRVDVCLYEETPEEVSAAWKQRVPLDGMFKVVSAYPGWGLSVLELVSAARAE